MLCQSSGSFQDTGIGQPAQTTAQVWNVLLFRDYDIQYVHNIITNFKIEFNRSIKPLYSLIALIWQMKEWKVRDQTLVRREKQFNAVWGSLFTFNLSHFVGVWPWLTLRCLTWEECDALVCGSPNLWFSLSKLCIFTKNDFTGPLLRQVKKNILRWDPISIFHCAELCVSIPCVTTTFISIILKSSCTSSKTRMEQYKHKILKIPVLFPCVFCLSTRKVKFSDEANMP